MIESEIETAPVRPPYDGAVAASSLHWLDLDATLPRLHRWLRPGALFVPWWTVFGDPNVDTPFRDRLRHLAEGVPLSTAGRPSALDTARWEGLIEEGGWFRVIETEVLRWSTKLTTEQVHDLFSTFYVARAVS